MPILWRYLLSHYLKVLFLTIFAFIAILLVSRLQEIAQFAAMGAEVKQLMLFTAYQVPYILPIALPIACLISAIILFQRLSHTQELTALRAAGLPLKAILAPLLLAAAFLSLMNFYITSELSTASHLATRKMAYELTSINPIVLLQNAKIAKLKGAYVQMDPIRNGEAAENLLIAMPNHLPQNRLHLLIAKKIALENGVLKGKDVSLISTIPTTLGAGFDHLAIENQRTTASSAAQFARLLRQQGWKISGDHLKFSLLRERIATFEQLAKSSETTKLINKCYSEIIRRLSLGLSPFTFTLLGIAFGMEINRHRSKRGIISVILLAAISLILFFVAKEFDAFLLFASTLFIFPHLLIVGSSLWTLSRINAGRA